MSFSVGEWRQVWHFPVGYELSNDSSCISLMLRYITLSNTGAETPTMMSDNDECHAITGFLVDIKSPMYCMWTEKAARLTSKQVIMCHWELLESSWKACWISCLFLIITKHLWGFFFLKNMTSHLERCQLKHFALLYAATDFIYIHIYLDASCWAEPPAEYWKVFTIYGELGAVLYANETTCAKAKQFLMLRISTLIFPPDMIFAEHLISELRFSFLTSCQKHFTPIKYCSILVMSLEESFALDSCMFRSVLWIFPHLCASLILSKIFARHTCKPICSHSNIKKSPTDS